MPIAVNGQEYDLKPIFKKKNQPSSHYRHLEEHVFPHQPFWHDLEQRLSQATTIPQLKMLHRQALEKTDIPPELSRRRQRFLDNVIQRLDQLEGKE